ncbi:MAG: hypothetical protein JXA90_00740 [Planctomycetes bacterium]|nr:hypothetical protein [Planctomycetota bacterium]
MSEPEEALYEREQREDTESLRERCSGDEDLLPLFSEDDDAIRSAVRRLVARVPQDAALESELIDALDVSLNEECDETQATAWLAVILGEARSRSAADVLLRALLSPDEQVQDAAGIAILRIGTPAVARLLEWVDEDHGAEFNRQAYRLLGETGILKDELLHRRVVQFLEERWPIERRAAREVSAIEELAVAFGRLGHRRQLPQIKELLARAYRGSHFAIEDAIACLEENEHGSPFVPTIAPWEDRYGWIFEDEASDAQVDPTGLELPDGFLPPGDSLRGS